MNRRANMKLRHESAMLDCLQKARGGETLANRGVEN